MAKQNLLLQKLAGVAALIIAVSISLVPFVDLSDFILVPVGLYLLFKKRKLIG